MIEYHSDGSATFISDTNPAITQIAVGAPAQIATAYAAFLVANPPPKLVRQTPSDFLNLFTGAEQQTIAGGLATHPALFAWYLRMLVSGEVDVTAPGTIAGINGLVTAGLLSAARGATILAGQ
jgi:hypothetical protein